MDHIKTLRRQNGGFFGVKPGSTYVILFNLCIVSVIIYKHRHTHINCAKL